MRRHLPALVAVSTFVLITAGALYNAAVQLVSYWIDQ